MKEYVRFVKPYIAHLTTDRRIRFGGTIYLPAYGSWAVMVLNYEDWAEHPLVTSPFDGEQRGTPTKRTNFPASDV